MGSGCAIYCSGPSLAYTLKPGTSERYEIVIAVNHAAVHACFVGERVDWFAGRDKYVLSMMAKAGPIDPQVGLLCTVASRDNYLHGDHPLRRDLKTLVVDELPNRKKYGGASYTALSAILLSEALGYTHVDCYGVDMVGGEHVGGGDVVDRPERWERERGMLMNILSVREESGLTLTMVRV